MVHPHDSVALAGAVATFAATAAVAGSLPAHRAARIDPTTTLREG